MPENRTLYSVIVPVYNEKNNLADLHGEILATMESLKQPYEIIYVNDGSTDGSDRALTSLNKAKIITLRTNFGQSAALDAGIDQANGEILITLDGDGQNDPADIPKLLNKLKSADLDVVCGWRKHRKDPAKKRFISFGARLLRSLLVDDGVHDSGCTLRVYKKEAFSDLQITGEMHRMIPAILKWRGFNVGEIAVNHRPRKHGSTKYTWTRTLKGFLDMVQVWFWRKYGSRPLHLFGGMGLLLIATSGALLLTLGVMRLFFGYRLSDRIWPLVGTTGFLAGLQLVVFGILADMVSQNNKDEPYLIKKIDDNN